MNETEQLPTPPADEPAATPARRTGLRPMIIGVASGLAVLALGVGGAVIADSIGGDDETLVVSSRDDSTPVPAATPSPTSTHDGSDDSGHGSDDSGHGSDDSGSSKAPITTDEHAAVSAAAVAAAGGSGTVEELKREDDGAVAWEVDVRLPNGAKVEVELAADLSVLSTRIDD